MSSASDIGLQSGDSHKTEIHKLNLKKKHVDVNCDYSIIIYKPTIHK